jgi:hypothetical protein
MPLNKLCRPERGPSGKYSMQARCAIRKTRNFYDQRVALMPGREPRKGASLSTGSIASARLERMPTRIPRAPVFHL